jgi:putative membrane protein insertion efficiency factor
MNLEKPSLVKIAGSGFRAFALFVLGVYQSLVSPLFPPCCRFYPSCSAYAREAIEKRGLVRGGILALIRICKCHPLHPGGYDPLS